MSAASDGAALSPRTRKIRTGSRFEAAAEHGANDGSHIWAERFDRTIDDIFDIQDEITKEIVSALPG